MTDYQYPMFSRLEPRTPFRGGRITETDLLGLTEAAKFASVHAGVEITPADFLRAAGRGEIALHAIVHRAAKLQRIGGGVYCNSGQPDENTTPEGSIPTLSLLACKHLAATGRASWRTYDGFELMNGQLMRYTVAELLPNEPDFETVVDDCRVSGNAINALADAYFDEPEPSETTATPVPVPVEQGGTGTIWTPERKTAARAMRDELRGQGNKAFAKTTAEKFGVTPTRLREVLKDNPTKAPAKKAKGFWDR